MPSSDKSIRVIKRSEHEREAPPQETPESELKTESQTRREIFNTITLWIEQQKETKKELQERDCLLLKNASINIGWQKG